MIGLTLEGGGVKGAYQIGAWKAFRELGMEFQGITGTSVGSFNGGLMVQDDFDTAWDFWYNITPQQVMTLDDEIHKMLCDKRLDYNDISVIIDDIRKMIKISGIDSSPLLKMIQKMIKEEVIRNSSMDFGFVTFSLTDAKPLELFKEDIPSGKMSEYLLASSYLPVFKERLLDGKMFLDGGFYNNLPANMLVRKGYKEIYAVRLLSAGRIIKVDQEDANIHYIEPVRDLGGMLDFNQKQIRQNLSLGYYDTLKKIRGYHGRRYYLEDFPEEGETLRMISQWPEEVKKEICKTLELKSEKALNRLFFEEAIPALIKLSDMDETNGYRELLLRITEAVAEACDVDHLRVYTFEEWMRTISTCPWEKEKNEANGLASFIKISESLFKPGREKKKDALLNFFIKNRESFSQLP